MFKKTNSQGETKRAGRVRMNTLNASPKLHDVRMVLVEAQRAKGTLCELPIQSPTGMFLLSCQNDHLSAEPCWTLYEGLDGSKQVWSYMNEDLEMITDIVNMSISEKAPQAGVNNAFAEVNTALTNELNAKAADEYKPWGQFSQQPEQPAPAAPAAPAPQQTWPQPDQQQQQQQSQWPTQPGGYPQQQQQPMPDQSQSQWPTQPGGYPQQPQQYQQPPQQYPQQQWPEAAPAPAPAPAASPSPWLTPQAPTDNKASMNKFLALLDSNKNMTVGELLFASDLPATCADSAMRLQEMICKSEISDKGAVDALRLAAQRGSGVVDDSILSEIRMRSTVSIESARAAVTMLKDAGLITEADANAAEMKAEKEGKDIAEMLIAGGKSDKLMVDGATKCVELVNQGKIRSDQAIIALHYCQRARAPIDQAFDDLSIDVS
jgi:hypothetical protein